MTSNDEKKTRKLVGMLIEVLHGEYSDTRDLAVVQLALMGQKAVPFICSYLKEQGELEKDLIEYHKMHAKWITGPWKSRTTGPVYPGRHYSKDELESIKLYEVKTKFADNFKKKWGCYPLEDGDTDREDYKQRNYAVEGALKALSIVGDPKAIPVLKKLPICDYIIRTELESLTHGKVPLFSKAKETIERIQSGV